MDIQFLQFATGQPHDLARGLTFHLDLNCKSHADCEFTMEVMGPYLIMIVIYKTHFRFSRRHQKIYFVEWTEGRMRCVSCMRHYPNKYSSSEQVRHVRDSTYFPAISFVSKDLIVLARKRDFSLEICEIRGDDNATLTLQTVCILKLPSLHPSTRVRFYMRNKTPFASNSSPPALRTNRLPFRSAPADVILGFEISVRRYGRPGAEIRRLAFWVHHSALRKYAAQAARPSGVLPEPKSLRGMRGLASRLVKRIGHTFATTPVLHWLEWGPKSTR